MIPWRASSETQEQSARPVSRPPHDLPLGSPRMPEGRIVPIYTKYMGVRPLSPPGDRFTNQCGRCWQERQTRTRSRLTRIYKIRHFFKSSTSLATSCSCIRWAITLMLGSQRLLLGQTIWGRIDQSNRPQVVSIPTSGCPPKTRTRSSRLSNVWRYVISCKYCSYLITYTLIVRSCVTQWHHSIGGV